MPPEEGRLQEDHWVARWMVDDTRTLPKPAIDLLEMKSRVAEGHSGSWKTVHPSC